MSQSHEAPGLGEGSGGAGEGKPEPCLQKEKFPWVGEGGAGQSKALGGAAGGRGTFDIPPAPEGGGTPVTHCLLQQQGLGGSGALMETGSCHSLQRSGPQG